MKNTNILKSELSLIILLIAASSPILASSSANGNLADFSSARNQFEPFSSSVSYTTTLRLSSQGRVLVGNPQDLQNDAYVCPSRLTATATHSIVLSDVEARGEKAGGVDVPRDWNQNEIRQGQVQLDNNLFSTIENDQNIRRIRYLVDENAERTATDARYNIIYIRELGGDQQPDSGAAKEGVLCTGNTQINAQGNVRNVNFAGNSAEHSIDVGAGDYAFQERANILDCHGIVQPLDPDLQPLFDSRKYVYYTGGNYQQSTQQTPAINIYVRNPVVSPTSRISRVNGGNPPQEIQMELGENPAQIEFQVTNPAGSAPRKIRVTQVSQNNNAVRFSAQGLPSAWIDPGAIQTLSGTLTPISAFRGNLNLLISVEADGIICDGSTPRLQIPVQITVNIVEPEEELPDLLIPQAVLSNQNPRIGENLRISAQVRNSGQANAGATVTCLDITKPNGQRLQPIRVNTQAINVGAQRQVDFNYQVQEPAGRNDFVITADCGGQVEEEREDNNQYGGSFTSLPVEEHGVNLRIVSGQMPQNPQAGSRVNIPITIENNGSDDINSAFTTCIYLTPPGGEPVRYSLNSNALASGAQATLTYRDVEIQFPPGENNLHAFTDCTRQIQETNENDNERDWAFNSVAPQNLPNLQAQVLPIPPPRVCVNDFRDLGFRVTNAGNANAQGEFTNTITVVAPDDSQTSRNFALDGLARGQSRDFSRRYQFTQEGIYQVIAIADSGRSIYESNENDNSGTRETRANSLLPDLAASEPSHSPRDEIDTNSMMSLSVLVTNIGCASTPHGVPITMRTEISNPAHGGRAGRDFQQAGPLAIGQSARFQDMNFQLDDSFLGLNRYAFTADHAGQIREIDEGNNRATGVFTAGQGLERSCIVLSPSSPLETSEEAIPAIVRYFNFQPQESPEFDCGNGQDTLSLSCQSLEDESVECRNDSGCVYSEEGGFTARTVSPENPSCSVDLEVNLDEIAECVEYI